MRRALRQEASLALAALLAASVGRAEDVPRPQPPRHPAVPPARLPAELTPGPQWSLHLGQSGVFDTNIDHTSDARPDYGVVFMGGAAWRNRPSRPSFQVSYEAGLHRYRESPKWDRVSHRAQAAFEKRLSKRWTAETRGEVSLKGSSEDRELGNQYVLLEQMDFRLVRGLGLRLYGVARLKRYAEPDKDRDATNTYAGAALKLRLGAARFELGSRYENNDARSERQEFGRWVHGAQLAAALSRHDDIGLDVRLYDQQYPFRTVRVGSRRELRQDQRFVSAVSWNHVFERVLGVELAYRYERRASNDPDKEFNGHQIAVEFHYRVDRTRYRATEPSPSRRPSTVRRPARPAQGEEDVSSGEDSLQEALAFASADEWDRKGISLLNSGSYAAAVRLYRRAVVQHPSLRARVQNLTIAYSQNGDHELAYCLDPKSQTLRRAWEREEVNGSFCPETR